MYNLEKITPIIFKDKKIYQAVEKINKSKTKIIFVIDKKKKTSGLNIQWRYQKINKK